MTAPDGDGARERMHGLAPSPGNGAAMSKALLIASTGGHLAQLVRLSRRWNISDDSLWVTFDSPQSRTLLEGRRTFFLPYVAPRDYRGVLRSTVQVARATGGEKFDVCVSTGAGVALAGFLAARGRGVPCVYVESVSRISGPSLTGKIVHRLRLARTFTQHEGWASPSWRHVKSVLLDFERAPRPDRPLTRILVTLGTIKPYRFDALVDRIKQLDLGDVEIVWQLGVTERSDLSGQVFTFMPQDELLAAAEKADVVVTHAGVGTMLDLFERGIYPVLVPRRAERGEHVDDHQLQITRLLASAGLAKVCEVDDLDEQQLREALSWCIVEKSGG
jgi:UDP-N-acetylglucosamine--N-acetylmuramyl-(pentapeptide) pyrophosphoryl-undecaprenol N-acetylglucosamine transferase